MRAIMHTAIGFGAAAVVMAAPASARATGDQKSLWGNHSGVLVAEPYVISGTLPAGFVAPNTEASTAGVAAGAGGAATSYSRTRVQLSLHAGFYAAETMFKTLLGFEFKAMLGYGSRFQKEADSNVNFRMDMLASYALFRWRGALPGRFVFAPGVGVDTDSGRPYQAGYVYPSLGGRVIVHPGKALDARVTYDFIPSVSGDLRMVEHQFGAGFNYKALAIGARLQLNRIAYGPTTSTETSLAGSAGFAF
jgi:hypothetical protein